ncbi:DUF4838 domain-containing protein [Paenibacillus sp. PAMC21692]|uniref:DUF4838 domain-containing protein n=1 Tax=Paenibacillus sp. PAMC21692 TaxID=2762320 RepID=UPI00164E7902|nr:DUF4838 domain-containing protein [Paenibacillus sp. PAMC21692]QNK58947.1 DUF4838 domain-containing protein [Paenibacillus sp. PAMC21692]
MMVKRKCCLLLSLLLLIQSAMFTFSSSAAANVSDITGHWANVQLNEWLNQGLITGYKDGTIRPDNAISRAEFIVLVNRAFGLTDEATIAYPDVKPTDWFYRDIAKAVKAGYLLGEANGKISPNANISRQEGAVIVNRLLNLEVAGTLATPPFKDAGDIANWSMKAVSAIVSEQIMKGYGGNLFRPQAPVTRAEAIVMLDRARQDKSRSYSKAGIYGPAKGIAIITGDVMIQAPGLTLRNTIINGSLIFAKGIDAGDASLVGVTVKGATTISGGANNIRITDSTLPKVIIEAENSSIRMARSSIGQMFVMAGATGGTIVLDAGAIVEYMEIYTEIKVTGEGKVVRMNNKATGSPSGSGTPIVPVSPTEAPAQDITIVKEGQAKAVILTGVNPDAQSLGAARTLSEYVQKSTGAELPLLTVGTENVPENAVRIYVGTVEAVDEQEINGLLAGLTDDGFVIVPGTDKITIIGPTAWGTEFGVYEFLERYLGVAWLMPGPDGEDVPTHQTIAVSMQTVREQPATLSRHFFGTEDPPLLMGSSYPSAATSKAWAKRNRMYDNIQFHHNFTSLFDLSVFADHPEYYPGGELPTHPYLWQVCFNDDTANAAITRIKQYFDANPDKKSYSLGINDGANFCESNPAHPNYPGELNSIGVLNMSDLYYPWVNQIVEGVLEEYPDKYFGLLAYANVYDPPSNIELNDHVIPYITDDRMTWDDPRMGVPGKLQTEKWSEAAASIGWYEYLYGSPFNVPRMYVHNMAENYKYAAEQGVVGHVAELFPNFGEGPKPWISAKLQWDPEQDVDELLNEWYNKAVGPGSAPYLKLYYEFWETFWTTRIFQTDWYLNWANSPNRTNHLPGIYDASYLKALTKEEIAESRRLMELVVAYADTAQQQKRANLLMRSFEYYEASALSYPRDKDITPPAADDEAVNLLLDNIASMEYAQKRMDLVNEFVGNPILEFQLTPPTFGGMWSGLQDGVFNTLADYLEHAPTEGEFIQKLKEMSSSDTITVRNYSLLLLAVANNAQNLISNPSFEDGNGDESDEWWYWTEGTGSMKRTNTVSRTGAYSVEIDGVVTGGGPVQRSIPVKPGYYGALVRYYTPADFNPNAKSSIQWWLNMQGSNNQHLGSAVTAKTLVAPNRGKWSTMEVIFEVPDNGSTAEMVFPVWDIEPGTKIYIDDVSLYRLDGAATVAQTISGDGLYVSNVNPLGQTFETPAGTGWSSIGAELLIEKNLWLSGIALTLSVYDSPDKTTLLGSTSISGPVASYFEHFRINAPTTPQTSYYMELTSNSVDGVYVAMSVADAYADGSAYQNGAAIAKDLYFNLFLSN